MNAHTPGPWIVLPWLAKDGSEITTIQAVNRTIADIPGEDGFAKANACLISAAPDLLEALERIIPWARKGIVEGIHKNCVAPNDLDGAINQAREAIAKAKGQP